MPSLKEEIKNGIAVFPKGKLMPSNSQTEGADSKICFGSISNATPETFDLKHKIISLNNYGNFYENYIPFQKDRIVFQKETGSFHFSDTSNYLRL